MMKKSILTIYLTFLVYSFFSCKDIKTVKGNSFEVLEFSYNDFLETYYSVKFNQSDSVIVCQHWYHNDDLKENEYYSTKISTKEYNTLDSIVNSINWVEMDTLYYDDYEDGDEYMVYIQNKKFSKNIIVHSLSHPKELREFCRFVDEMIARKKLKPIVSNYQFNGISKFSPQPPPFIFSE